MVFLHLQQLPLSRVGLLLTWPPGLVVPPSEHGLHIHSINPVLFLIIWSLDIFVQDACDRFGHLLQTIGDIPVLKVLSHSMQFPSPTVPWWSVSLLRSLPPCRKHLHPPLFCPVLDRPLQISWRWQIARHPGSTQKKGEYCFLKGELQEIQVARTIKSSSLISAIPPLTPFSKGFSWLPSLPDPLSSLLQFSKVRSPLCSSERLLLSLGPSPLLVSNNPKSTPEVSVLPLPESLLESRISPPLQSSCSTKLSIMSISLPGPGFVSISPANNKRDRGWTPDSPPAPKKNRYSVDEELWCWVSSILLAVDFL